MNHQRCGWVGENKPHYEAYHDEEWGRPVYEDNKLFEMLILEGAQAGLNWETVLKKRDAYRQAFHNFKPQPVSKMSDLELETLCHNEAIIRNRRKIWSARKNAQVFIEIQQQFGSFSDYLWAYVNGKPIINCPKTLADIPTTSPESVLLSKDLKKRGMSFVGPTIMYAYMQAVGLVDDHVEDCFLSTPLCR